MAQPGTAQVLNRPPCKRYLDNLFPKGYSSSNLGGGVVIFYDVRLNASEIAPDVDYQMGVTICWTAAFILFWCVRTIAKITVKGYEFEAVSITDSFNRRAMQFKNKIITSISRLGLTVDDVDIELEPNGIKKAPASVSWFFDGWHLHYSHNSRNKYVENLYVVFKVVDFNITALIEGRMTIDDFLKEFSEDIDIAKKRKEARVALGLDHDVNDLNVIDKAYKNLAKKHHPDTETGDAEKFKEINRAHKMLKRELT